MNVLKENWGVIIGVLLSFVVGVFLGFVLGHRATEREAAEAPIAPVSASQSTTSQTTKAGSSASKPEAAASDAVVVGDQPAGNSVAVKTLTLSQSGWVAVRDADGKTLGAALFDAGTQADVSVPLLRATAAGQRYQVLLYYDDGKREFNLQTETLVMGTDGAPVGTNFTAK